MVATEVSLDLSLRATVREGWVVGGYSLERGGLFAALLSQGMSRILEGPSSGVS